MEKAKLSDFGLKPLVDLSAYNPDVGFLGREAGKEIDKEVKGKYKNFPVMGVTSYSAGLIKGSNPFYIVGVNEEFRAQSLKLRTATQADLELILKYSRLPLRGTYEDSALVLRSAGEPNSYLARNLYKQVKARNTQQMLPVMIPLAGLELAKDSDSEYGLSFTLKENAEIIYAPILNKNGGFDSESINEKTGLPKRFGDGDRTLAARDSGLSRLYLNGDLDLYSWDDVLAYSYGDGRVVVVDGSAEGAKK